MPRHATSGSYKKGDERLIGNKFGELQRGKKLSESHRKSFIEGGRKTRFKKGQPSPNKGKPLSEETKKKLSEAIKKRWEQGERYNKNGLYLNVFGGFRRTTHRKAIFRRKLVEEIGKCEICGFSNEKALVLHHKDKDFRNNTRDNLQLLCANCHSIKHK